MRKEELDNLKNTKNDTLLNLMMIDSDIQKVGETITKEINEVNQLASKQLFITTEQNQIYKISKICRQCQNNMILSLVNTNLYSNRMKHLRFKNNKY